MGPASLSKVRYYRMAGHLAKNGFEKTFYLFQIGFACLQSIASRCGPFHHRPIIEFYILAPQHFGQDNQLVAAQWPVLQ